ncbi:MAG: Gx transporter family protein [candidate division WOR-3 bacterium]|nr:MAG: Gx transporter family protein [candidate division WOR-3 bacterium]
MLSWTRRPTRPAGSAPARLAVLAALACVLQVGESMLPHPIPGVRFGLANVVSLIALVQMGPVSAIGVVLLRTLVSSIFLGTFLTPSFVLSISGGLVSILVMIPLYAVSAGRRFPVFGRGKARPTPCCRAWARQTSFGFVGISVAGSVSHVLTQLLVVYALFVPARGVWLVWPWLALSAVVMGIITGLIAGQVFRQLAAEERPETEPPSIGREPVPVQGQYVAGTTLLHRAPVLLKVLVVVALAVVVIVRVRLYWYAAVVALLVVATAVARTRLSAVGHGLGRLLVLVVFSFVMPVLFTSWGPIIFSLGPLRVTHDGLLTGTLFAGRIIILYWATALLAATSRPEDIARAIAALLYPLRVFGVSTDKIARTVVLTWEFFPKLWHKARSLVAVRDQKVRLRDSLVRAPGTLVTRLYMMADAAAGPASRPGEQADE